MFSATINFIEMNYLEPISDFILIPSEKSMRFPIRIFLQQNQN